MTAQREDLLTPSWTRDRVDSFDPPEVEDAYFASELQAWVLSRHADLLAAFHAPSLIRGRRELADVSLDSEEAALFKMRDEVRRALSPAQVRAWREELRIQADGLCQQLPVAEPVDLIAAYARPLCLRFAAMVTHIAQDDADDLEELAKVVSAATADPEDPALRVAAKDANAILRSHFSAGPELLRDPGFVGLSQTLLRIIGASWYALAQSPCQWQLLRSSPESVDQAMEELLRYAGIVRMLSRTATEDINLNGIPIRKGDRIILRVFAANHDPERFCEPKKFDCARRDPGHFAFGAGGHACVAANLIRTAAISVTLPLLSRFVSVKLVRQVEWKGGSAMRSPASLWVALSCS
jgi:hypothetical protein